MIKDQLNRDTKKAELDFVKLWPKLEEWLVTYAESHGPTFVLWESPRNRNPLRGDEMLAGLIHSRLTQEGITATIVKRHSKLGGLNDTLRIDVDLR